MFFWDESLCFHGFYSTKSLPGGPHQEADAGAPFHSKLGSVLSQSVDWPLSQLNGLSQLQQSEDVSTTVKNFKKTLVGVQWYSVLFFPNRTPPSCLQESRFPNTKNNSFRGGHVSSGNSPFPQPEGRRPSCAMVPGWCWFPLHPRVAWSSTSG